MAGQNRAELVPVSDQPDVLRLEIQQVDGSCPWDIQLNRPRLPLAEGEQYRAAFSVRSDAPREIRVGISMAHDPWSGLGLYEVVAAGPEWRQYDLAFTAAAADDNARLHFDLGGSEVNVELRGVQVCTADGRAISGAIQFGSLRRVTPVSRDWGFDRGLPVDRWYVEQFLRKWSPDIRGRVLEIGDNSYTRRFGGDKVTKSDVLNVREGDPNTTFVADLTDARNIADDTFDCVICTQTLQFVYEVRAAVATLERILKPGGTLLATFPGISQNNDAEWASQWFWNFTPPSASRMFREAFPGADIQMETFGNVLSASSFLYGLAAGELTQEELTYTDRGYEVLHGLRVVKPTAAARTLKRGRNEGHALVLMYHRIGEPGADPFSLSVQADNFSRQMAVVRRRGRVIALQTLSQCVRDGQVPDGFVAVTFDDGYADNLHIAKPLLDEFRIPATVFVTTGAIGGQEFWWDALERLLLHNRDDGKQRFLETWNSLRLASSAERARAIGELAGSAGTGVAPPYLSMQEPEIAQLAEGGWIEVGAHSVNHPFLTELPPGEQRREIEESRRRLEALVGRPVTSFAYPYGAFSAETAELARATGVECACTTMPSPVTSNSDVLALPRFQVGNWDADEFSARLDQWLSGGVSAEEFQQ